MSDEERKFFRSSVDGERGYLIHREGVDYIKLDRPNEEVLRHYNNGQQWVPDVERRPLSKGQIAKVCFEADRELCRALGMYDQTRKDWLDLSDKLRIAWMNDGPQKTPERKALWSAIQMILEPLTR